MTGTFTVQVIHSSHITTMAASPIIMHPTSVSVSDRDCDCLAVWLAGVAQVPLTDTARLPVPGRLGRCRAGGAAAGAENQEVRRSRKGQGRAPALL